MVDQTRREFLKLGLAAAASAVTASAIEIPMFGSQNSAMQTQLNNANTQVANLKNRVNTVVGFISLSVTEQSLLEKIVETIIPTDTDPGAKEAGVIYFIDRQLAGDYGQSANMFMDGPFIPPTQNAITGVPTSARYQDLYPSLPTSIDYSGTVVPRIGSGINYQYALNLRAFWKAGLEAVQNYSTKTPAYGTTFQRLSGANQLALLADLWAGKPSTF